MEKQSETSDKKSTNSKTTVSKPVETTSVATKSKSTTTATKKPDSTTAKTIKATTTPKTDNKVKVNTEKVKSASNTAKPKPETKRVSKTSITSSDTKAKTIKTIVQNSLVDDLEKQNKKTNTKEVEKEIKETNQKVNKNDGLLKSNPKSFNKEKLLVILYLVVISLCFVLSVFNFSITLSLLTSKDEMPTVFGSTPIIVQGNLDDKIKNNDLIFIKKVDTNTLATNDIICFKNNGNIFTYKILDIKESNGEKTFVTISSDSNTKFEVAPNNIYGKYNGRWKGFGGVIKFMKGVGGIIIFVVLPIVAYVTVEVVLFVKRKKNGLNKSVSSN